MRNMEKMGKEWGNLLSIPGGLISSHSNFKTFYVSVFSIVIRRVLPFAFIKFLL